MIRDRLRSGYVLCILIIICTVMVSSCSSRYSGPVFDKTHTIIRSDECVSGNGGHIEQLGDCLEFCYSADKPGFYDLEISYTQRSGSDVTLGLFVADHFCKKVCYGCADQLAVLTETVYLDEGNNMIRFEYLAGDGPVVLSSFRLTPSDKEITLVVAPHEDDEILGFCGTIENTLDNGDVVKVVLLTNGDYFSPSLSSIRIQETIRALSHIGLDSSDIIFMGYGDFLIWDLYLDDSSRTPFESKAGLTSTYASPDNNIYDYHTLDTGEPGPYTGKNFKDDLYNIICEYRPSIIYTTSEFEWHPDHKYAYRSVYDTILRIQEDHDYHPVLYQGVIHGENADWPDRGSMVFSDPFPSGDTPLNWEEAVHLELTDEMIRNKYDAISEYVTQNEGTDFNGSSSEFNFAFCKEEEFYWPFYF